MGFEFIDVQQEDRLTIITINRPDRMNALHPPANRELHQAFNAFADDDDAWIAIITGAGDRAFSAGNDLKYHAEHGGASVSEGMRGVTSGFGGLTRRSGLTKPLIAAVNGFALGGGFEIVLCCDIVLAAAGARFGLPEPRVGLMAGAGGVPWSGGWPPGGLLQPPRQRLMTKRGSCHDGPRRRADGGR